MQVPLALRSGGSGPADAGTPVRMASGTAKFGHRVGAFRPGSRGAFYSVGGVLIAECLEVGPPP